MAETLNEEEGWAEDSCEVCGGNEDLLRCSACKSVYYCSKRHQAAMKEAEESGNGDPTEDPHALENAEKARVQDADGDDENSDFKIVMVGLCGIHEHEDLSQYVHALNNMAGRLKIDQPLDRYDPEAVLTAEFVQSTTADRLGNGLLLEPGYQKRRAEGPLGIGLEIRGTVHIGVTTDDTRLDEKFTFTDASPSSSPKLTKEVRVSTHILAFPGAFVDSRCVLHGPLRYFTKDISAAGGIHYNGTAFETETTPEGRSIYKELCIEALLSTPAGKKPPPPTRPVPSAASSSSSSSSSASSSSTSSSPTSSGSSSS